MAGPGYLPVASPDANIIVALTGLRSDAKTFFIDFTVAAWSPS
jgi:hypothetical protein